ncbi:DUF4876 domain-containing protein [Sphingobacterium sp. Mn56C]|uniref:DUF4876 domain-containing protein n=1 Tax=Sphingobacterium sp. Mn56C TaxID=3395261 RepID=UPI003BC41F40
MKINRIGLMLLAVVLVGFFACKKDTTTEMNTGNLVVIQLEKPAEMSHLLIESLTATLKETNTGMELQWKGTDLSFTENLPLGVYTIQVEGKASYVVQGVKEEVAIAGLLQGAKVVAGQERLSLKLYVVNNQLDFVIEELYFTGSLTPENQQYLGDRYIKLYNNSERVLYADGLVIATTAFQTVDKRDYKPNIMEEAVAVDAVMVIPGNGKTYPVQPGGAIVIAESAINHKEFNRLAINLSQADFEIVAPDDDETIDNPNVPNLEALFDRIVINNRGFQSFILARIPVSKAVYLSDFTYAYSYKFVEGDFSFDMEDLAYKIPNEWVIDAVNLSVASEFKWLVTAVSLDRGWTYCGKYSGDTSRYGKSVRRKVIGTSAAGHRRLKDTNNSSVDFDAEVQPSLKN